MALIPACRNHPTVPATSVMTLPPAAWFISAGHRVTLLCDACVAAVDVEDGTTVEPLA